MVLWSLERRNIDEVYEYSQNPREISESQVMQLCESIKKFGQCQPIVINADAMVIGGHQRLRVMRALGYKIIDAYVPSEQLSNKAVEELNIRLNANQGSFDDDMLANLFDVEELIDWGMDLRFLDEDIDGKEEINDKKNYKLVITCANVDYVNEYKKKIEEAFPELYIQIKITGSIKKSKETRGKKRAKTNKTGLGSS